MISWSDCKEASRNKDVWKSTRIFGRHCRADRAISSRVEQFHRDSLNSMDHIFLSWICTRTFQLLKNLVDWKFGTFDLMLIIYICTLLYSEIDWKECSICPKWKKYKSNRINASTECYGKEWRGSSEVSFRPATLSSLLRSTQLYTFRRPSHTKSLLNLSRHIWFPGQRRRVGLISSYRMSQTIFSDRNQRLRELLWATECCDGRGSLSLRMTHSFFVPYVYTISTLLSRGLHGLGRIEATRDREEGLFFNLARMEGSPSVDNEHFCGIFFPGWGLKLKTRETNPGLPSL